MMLAFDTETQQVYTEFFDGPLELLLYLVRRQGVDIRHVKIAPITDAYLMHVRKMSLLKLDVAGDFLYLASTLCYLKSREMLPNATAPTEEETEDPLLIRERLAQQLIEYERFREASQILNQRDLLHRDVFTSPVPLETGPPSVNVNVDALGLLHIYRSILKQHQLPPPKHKVEKSTFSLIDMGEWILDCVEQPTTLASLFEHFDNKPDKIICFLTVLELAKNQILDVYQTEHLGRISIAKSYDQRPSLSSLFEITAS